MNRPVFLGEFGAALSNPDQAFRLRWTRFIVQAAKESGFNWSYWEYQANFGVRDPKAKQWRRDLLDALVGQ